MLTNILRTETSYLSMTISAITCTCIDKIIIKRLRFSPDISGKKECWHLHKIGAFTYHGRVLYWCSFSSKNLSKRTKVHSVSWLYQPWRFQANAKSCNQPDYRPAEMILHLTNTAIKGSYGHYLYSGKLCSGVKSPDNFLKIDLRAK